MSYLPDVVLPERELDDVEVRELPDDIDDSVEFQQLEEQDEGFGADKEQDLLPLPAPPKKKEKLKKEDIFKPKKAPPKKVSIAPEPAIDEPIIPKIAPVKKKRQMSEKQKEALAKGRAARAAKKKQAEALASPSNGTSGAPVYETPKSEVRYKEKKMNEDYQKQQYFTQEQVADMIYSGVQKYDTERKARKEKKKKLQASQNHEAKIFNDINSQLRVNDPWANTFNF